MKRYLIATLILAAASTPALAAAGQHYVVEDTEKFCSVIDAAPSKNLKVLGDRQGYGSRDQAEQAIKGLSCKRCPAKAPRTPYLPLWGGPTTSAPKGGRRRGVRAGTPRKLSPAGRGELTGYGLGFDFGLDLCAIALRAT